MTIERNPEFRIQNSEGTSFFWILDSFFVGKTAATKTVEEN